MSQKLFQAGYHDAMHGVEARYFGPSYQRGYFRAQIYILCRALGEAAAMGAGAFLTGVSVAFWFADIGVLA